MKARGARKTSGRGMAAQGAAERGKQAASVPDDAGLDESLLEPGADHVEVLDAELRLRDPSAGGLPARTIDAFGTAEGTPWLSLWDGAHAAAAEAAIRDAKAGRVGRFRAPRRTAQGAPRWWEVMISSVAGADGRVERFVCMSREITLERRRRSKLKAVGERYRALVASSATLVWRSTPDGRMREGFGFDRYPGQFAPEFLGERWLSAVHPDDRDEVTAHWSRVLQTGEPKPVDYRVRHADGTYRWVQARGAPVKGEDGRIREWVGTLTDIHQQREANQALRESEERLRLATEATGLGIWDIDFVSGARQWSPEMRSILGVAADAPIGRDVFVSCLHPDDPAWIERWLYEEVEKNRRLRYDDEFRIRRASDGAERWVATSGRLILDRAGQPARSIGTIQDVTERKKVQADLRASEERFRNIASTSPDAFVSINVEGRITFWNTAAEQIFGHTAAEAVGAPIDIIIPERLRAAHHAGFARAAERASAGSVGRTNAFTGLHRSGRELPLEISLSMWLEDGRPNFGAIVRDVSERRHEERLFRLAHFDQLTDLPNRALLWDRITADLAANATAALLLLDLDGFKDVNDSLGHAAGDELLKAAAARLVGLVPKDALLSRVGGDEFAVFLPGVGSPIEAGAVVEAIHAGLGESFAVEGRSVFIGTSIGIAIAPNHGVNAAEMMMNADLALYEAKSEGRNTSRLFAPSLRQQVQARQVLEGELRRAFAGAQFALHYQPQVRLDDRAVIGAEALLRWRHPERGLLAPAAFLSALVNGPIAAQVGDWTIREACRQASRLDRLGCPIRIGVNLFSAQLRTGGLVATVREALDEAGLAPERLEIEITEDIILKNDDTILASLRRLRDLGVGIAFDDYGTGYASLSMLQRFPLTRLKIDRSFVGNLPASQGDVAIIDVVLKLGASFGLDVIAEGIENVEQEKLLLALGCREAQGFLYGKPIAMNDLEARLGLGQADQRSRA